MDVKGKIKTYHGNMLKMYYGRDTDPESKHEISQLASTCVSVIEHEEWAGEDEACENIHNKVSIQFPTLVSKETLEDVKSIMSWTKIKKLR